LQSMRGHDGQIAHRRVDPFEGCGADGGGFGVGV
jgi:hypothetical protein